MTEYQKLIAQIPKEEIEKIKKLAEEEKRSINSFTRKALSDYTKKLEKEKDGK